MNRIVLTIVIILLVAGNLSCAPWRAQYLDETLNRATENDVEQRLEQPKEAQALADGNTIWLYQVIGGTAPPLKSTGEPYCKEYRLTFDEDQILRHWESYRC